MRAPATENLPAVTADVDLDRLMPRLCRVFAERFSDPPWNESWDVDSAFEKLAGYRTQGGIFVALERRGELIGFACGCRADRSGLEEQLEDRPEFRPTDFYLAELVVSKAHEGRGHGTALMRALMNSAQSSGFARVVAMLHTNQPATREICQELGLTFVADGRATVGGQTNAVKIYCKGLEAAPRA